MSSLNVWLKHKKKKSTQTKKIIRKNEFHFIIWTFEWNFVSTDWNLKKNICCSSWTLDEKKMLFGANISQGTKK